MFEISFTLLQFFISGIAFIICLGVIIILSNRHLSSIPYERLKSILTPAEQHFYKVLSFILKERVIIMAKVRIADLLKVCSSMKQKHFWSYFSKISQKHIDFILIDPNTFKTICLIELDDKSHNHFSRSKRDKFVNRIMEQTGIPLYRIRVQRQYDYKVILQTLEGVLSGY